MKWLPYSPLHVHIIMYAEIFNLRSLYCDISLNICYIIFKCMLTNA